MSTYPGGEVPGFPEPMPPFDELAPSHYRVLVRRAQHFQVKQVAAELGIRPGTVDQYLDRAKERLRCPSRQELIQWYVRSYGPGLWPPVKEGL